jgi:hypothetical protein
MIQATLDLPGNPRVPMELPVDTDGDFLSEAWESRANVGNLSSPWSQVLTFDLSSLTALVASNGSVNSMSTPTCEQ